MEIEGEIPSEVTAEDAAAMEYDSETDGDDPVIPLDAVDEALPAGIEYDTTKPEEQSAVFHDFRNTFSNFVMDYAQKRGKNMGRPSEEAIE